MQPDAYITHRSLALQFIKQKIAIVANSTWNIYNFRLNIIQKLLDENYEVIVMAPLDEYIKYKEKFPEVKHIALKNLHRDTKKPFKDLGLILELRRLYTTHRPDIILHYTHKPNIYGGMAARLAGIPSVAVITGLGYAFLHEGMTQTVTKLLYRMVAKQHTAFVFENEDDKNFFIEQGLISQAQGKAVLGCGVDTNKYRPNPNGKTREKTIFTFIGRLLYDKGIVEFIEAARMLKNQNIDLEFWIVGELDEGNPSMLRKQELLSWIDEDVIVYHGFLKDVRPIMAQSTCIVLPSYREGMPRIILEAMAMAKPVITTLTAGCRQTVVEGQNGFLVPVGDSSNLAKAMAQIAAMSEVETHQMGENGRKMAIKHFNSEKIAQDLYEIISQA